jgi:hypothetical protein
VKDLWDRALQEKLRVPEEHKVSCIVLASSVEAIILMTPRMYEPLKKAIISPPTTADRLIKYAWMQ